MAVGAVDTAAVIRTLEPIWMTKHETAQRVRNRIEMVLDYAIARGFRSGPNPAKLAQLGDNLPSRKKLMKTRRLRKEHFAALPYEQIGDFMTELRALPGIVARALEFTILVAARTGEVLGAVWSEIDLVKAEWNIPAERMKSDRPHRVLLSDDAIALLRELPRTAELVFPASAGVDHPLADNALRRLVRNKMQRPHITIHGFRSAFSTWGNECTTYSHHTIEVALAHQVGSETARAYARGDQLAKRRGLMSEWAKFCAMPSLAPGDNVVAIGQRRG
jgi:integrase